MRILIKVYEVNVENNIIDAVFKISNIQHDTPRKAEHISMLEYFEDGKTLNDLSYTMSDFSMFGYMDAEVQGEMDYPELQDIVDIIEEMYLKERVKIKRKAFLINGIHVMII